MYQALFFPSPFKKDKTSDRRLTRSETEAEEKSEMAYCSSVSKGGARVPTLCWEKKENMTEGRKSQEGKLIKNPPTATCVEEKRYFIRS